MQILTPGHKYEIPNFEDDGSSTTLQFIEKVPEFEGSTKLRTINNGITNETLISVLVDRINFLNAKFPCRENSIALTNLETALLWLNKRTSDRMKRGVEGKQIA